LVRAKERSDKYKNCNHQRTCRLIDLARRAKLIILLDACVERKERKEPEIIMTF